GAGGRPGPAPPVPGCPSSAATDVSGFDLPSLAPSRFVSGSPAAPVAIRAARSRDVTLAGPDVGTRRVGHRAGHVGSVPERRNRHRSAIHHGPGDCPRAPPHGPSLPGGPGSRAGDARGGLRTATPTPHSHGPAPGLF